MASLLTRKELASRYLCTQPMAGLGQIFPGGTPKIAMTPLLAAVVNKQRPAAPRSFSTAGLIRIASIRSLARRFTPPREREKWTCSSCCSTAGAMRAPAMLEHRRPAEWWRPAAHTLGRFSAGPGDDEVDGRQAPQPSVDRNTKRARCRRKGWDACERLLKARGAK